MIQGIGKAASGRVGKSEEPRAAAAEAERAGESAAA